VANRVWLLKQGAGPKGILDQYDGLGVGEVAIGQFFQDVSVVYGGMAISTLTWRQPSSGANIMKRLAVPLRSYS
jgi:hypothetical protein